MDAFIYIYELHNMVLLAGGTKNPSMPTWMLQCQLRQATHACCLPVLLSQLPQAPSGDTWGPAHLSRASSQDNGKPGSVSWPPSETAQPEPMTQKDPLGSAFLVNF